MTDIHNWAGLALVSHGTDADLQRPPGALPGQLHWVGSVAPSNGAADDVWLKNDDGTLHRHNGLTWVALGGGSGTSSSLAWVGPYVIRWDDANLLTTNGRVLFTPTVGSFLTGYIAEVMESFVGAVGETPRLALGTWSGAGENVIGFDSDIPVDASVPLWVGTDLVQMPDAGPSTVYSGTKPGRFATTSPVRVNCINGALDMGDQAKPYPPCASLSAGIAHLYFQIATPTAP